MDALQVALYKLCTRNRLPINTLCGRIVIALWWLSGARVGSPTSGLSCRFRPVLLDCLAAPRAEAGWPVLRHRNSAHYATDPHVGPSSPSAAISRVRPPTGPSRAREECRSSLIVWNERPSHIKNQPLIRQRLP